MTEYLKKSDVMAVVNKIVAQDINSLPVTTFDLPALLDDLRFYGDERGYEINMRFKSVNEKQDATWLETSLLQDKGQRARTRLQKLLQEQPQ